MGSTARRTSSPSTGMGNPSASRSMRNPRREMVPSCSQWWAKVTCWRMARASRNTKRSPAELADWPAWASSPSSSSTWVASNPIWKEGTGGGTCTRITRSGGSPPSPAGCMPLRPAPARPGRSAPPAPAPAATRARPTCGPLYTRRRAAAPIAASSARAGLARQGARPPPYSPAGGSDDPGSAMNTTTRWRWRGSTRGASWAACSSGRSATCSGPRSTAWPGTPPARSWAPWAAPSPASSSASWPAGRGLRSRVEPSP